MGVPPFITISPGFSEAIWACRNAFGVPGGKSSLPGLGGMSDSISPRLSGPGVLGRTANSVSEVKNG